MKIGIIGAGNLGTGLGKHLAAKGHDIVVSFARTPDKVAAAAKTIGPGARAGTPEEAAKHAEVLILATPWASTVEVLKGIAVAVSGKVVWDATNPYAPNMSELTIGTTTSAGEEVAKVAPKARVVKAIPPFAELLHSGSLMIDGKKPGAFVCGDDAPARTVVAALLTEIGVDAVNSGPLKLARFTEPLGMLVTNLAYVQGMGARIGSVLIHDTAKSP